MPAGARDWLVFPDPGDPDHEIRADLTWLLAPWQCLYGRGCRGVVAGRGEDGCCSHGAFFADRADERRVRAAARELTADTWQRHGTRRIAVTDLLRGEPARRTRTVDGACVFLNRPGFSAGPGCALHLAALRAGSHPMRTKPAVCWQLPLAVEERTRSDGRRVTVVTEFDRPRWGEGGADLHWWCTRSRAAHTAARPVVEGYAAELTELLGPAAYAELRRHCARRRGGIPALELTEP